MFCIFFNFQTRSRIKEIVKKKDIPLILELQTYGSFYDAYKKDKAAKIKRKAYEVYSREEALANVVCAIAHMEVISVTDLAFRLKYQKRKIIQKLKLELTNLVHLHWVE